MNKKNILSILVILLVVAMMGTFIGIGDTHAAGIDKSNWPKSITLTSGPVGGPWYPVFVTFAEYLTKEIPEVSWTVIPGSSIGNIRLVNKGVDAQIGITHFNILGKAMAGTLQITKGEKFNNIGVGMAVSLSYIQLVTPAKNENINNFKDIFDKRFAPGARTAGQTDVIRDLLAYYGKSYDSIVKSGGSVQYVNFSEMATLLADGHLDAACFTGDLPHASGMEVDLKMPLKLLKIDDDAMNAISKMYPMLAVEEGGVGAYRGVTKPVKMFGAVGTLLINKGLPDSLVYAFARVIMNNSDKIVKQYSNPNYCKYLNWEKTLQFGTEKSFHPMVWKAVKEGPAKK